MPRLINGVEYFSVKEIMREFGVTRQTVWRWRQDKVPKGRKFRNGQVLFTRAELESIREHATRVEPISDSRDQLKLFGGGK